MITGHVTAIGDIEYDGETVTGMVITCDREQLKNYGRNLAFKDVVIKEIEIPLKKEPKNERV